MAMTIGPTTMSAPEPGLPVAAREPAGLLSRQRAFSEVLSQAGGSKDGATPESEARQAAEDFVAMAFVQPVLKQLRETNHGAAPFAPGKGEQQFRALMDAEIARKVVRASDWPLVDRLAQQLLEHRQSTAAAGVRAGQGKTNE